MIHKMHTGLRKTMEYIGYKSAIRIVSVHKFRISGRLTIYFYTVNSAVFSGSCAFQPEWDF